MSSRRKRVELAYVRWFDSAIYKGEACQPDEISGFCENETAGLLLREDDNAVWIALDRCLDTQDVRCVLCIPKANVLQVRHLKV